MRIKGNDGQATSSIEFSPTEFEILKEGGKLEGFPSVLL